MLLGLLKNIFKPLHVLFSHLLCITLVLQFSCFRMVLFTPEYKVYILLFPMKNRVRIIHVCALYLNKYDNSSAQNNSPAIFETHAYSNIYFWMYIIKPTLLQFTRRIAHEIKTAFTTETSF